MKYFILILTAVLSLTSCGDDEKDEQTVVSHDNKEDSESLVNIEVLFDKEEFDNVQKAELLKELKVCSDKNQGPRDYMHPSCTPHFFELFQFSDKVALKNGFVLLTKSKTFGFPLRRIAIFVRDKGKLVKINEYVANLIGMQKNASGYNDLILRFNDKDQGEDVFYNCLFEWDGLKYQYKSVEVIEGANWGGAVKPELKDSISIEVEKDILENEMIIL